MYSRLELKLCGTGLRGFSFICHPFLLSCLSSLFLAFRKLQKVRLEITRCFVSNNHASTTTTKICWKYYNCGDPRCIYKGRFIYLGIYEDRFVADTKLALYFVHTLTYIIILQEWLCFVHFTDMAAKTHWWDYWWKLISKLQFS